MFHHSKKTNENDLKFDIAAPPNWTYAPGETIIGNLVRSAGIVSAQATVTLEFSGRANAEIDEERGGRKHHINHTHSVPLINEEKQVLRRGPLHLSSDSEEKLCWPFSGENSDYAGPKTDFAARPQALCLLTGQIIPVTRSYLEHSCRPVHTA
ncbi:hypothetical protein N7510_007832 [Penicillium lagena]|uniref:uncharacterized protein n=1 Tax=Penicillium lagena TaxID=94218 RepID=UPI0025420817|nr:uncharacterized protein N7510_007832 [Penicillium lagena]KAJ5611113.1 hypothetical protein N7510_007832 [Penicillium lagena]